MYRRDLQQQYDDRLMHDVYAEAALVDEQQSAVFEPLSEVLARHKSQQQGVEREYADGLSPGQRGHKEEQQVHRRDDSKHVARHHLYLHIVSAQRHSEQEIEQVERRIVQGDNAEIDALQPWGQENEGERRRRP